MLHYCYHNIIIEQCYREDLLSNNDNVDNSYNSADYVDYNRELLQCKDNVKCRDTERYYKVELQTDT